MRTSGRFVKGYAPHFLRRLRPGTSPCLGPAPGFSGKSTACDTEAPPPNLALARWWPRLNRRRRISGRMPRKSAFVEPRRCTYCAEHVPGTETVEWEHVFPDRWYSAATPANFAKPQVPSCHDCNHHHGLREERLRLRWAAGLPHDGSPARAGVWQAALRSMTPTPMRRTMSSEKMVKKAAAKLGNRRAVQRSAVLIAPDDAGKAIGVPIGSPRWVKGAAGLVSRGYPGLKIEGDDVRGFGAKLVRGISRYLWDLILASDQMIEVSPSRNDRRTETETVFRNPGLPVEVHDWGAGSLRFNVAAMAGRPELLSLWHFAIWDHVLLSAVVESPRLAQK
jgi:hypothetical protein